MFKKKKVGLAGGGGWGGGGGMTMFWTNMSQKFQNSGFFGQSYLQKLQNNGVEKLSRHFNGLGYLCYV